VFGNNLITCQMLVTPSNFDSQAYRKRAGTPGIAKTKGNTLCTID
jgi:hypothetical protein